MNHNRIIQLFQSYKTPIFYTASSVSKAIASMIVGIAIAKFVSPADFGLWNYLNIFINYSILLQMGVINGLSLELPYSLGKRDDELGNSMVATAQTFIIFISGVVLIIGICFIIYMYSQGIEKKMMYGIFTIIAIIILTYYQNFFISTFRSKSSFQKLSLIQIIETLITIISLAFVVYFSYYGLLIKSVLVILISSLLLYYYRPFKVRLTWNKGIFKKLIKVGFPIFGLASIESYSTTIDKLLLTHYTDLKSVGLYSFGFYGLTIFILLSNSIASYIYPKMTYNYAKYNDRNSLWQYVKKITILLLFIQLPLAIIGYFIVPVAIKAFFPLYLPSTAVMQILLFAGVFKGSVVGVNVLWSMKDWKNIVTYQLINSLLFIVTTFLCVHFFKNKIGGVAIGVLIAYFLNFICGLYLTYSATHTNKEPS